MTQENPVAVSAAAERKGQRFGALSVPAFRLFWLSMFVSFLGNQMQVVAQGWLVLELTNSPLFLGLAGGASGLPILLLSLFGGAVADRLERRRLILLCQLITSFLMLTIALLVLTGRVAVWQVMGIATGLGLIMAFNDPARQAFVTELVEKDNLLNAISLNATAMNVTRIGGPMVAGALIAAVGTGVSYLANTGLSLMAAATMLFIPKSTVGAEARKTTLWSNVKEGLSFVRGNRTLLWLLLFAGVPSIPGAIQVNLVPVFARNVLNVGAAGLGQIMGAMGLGALVGSIALASAGNLRHKGILFACSAMSCNLLGIAFALSTWFPLTLAISGVLGVAQAGWMASITTLIQTRTPNELRGRVMSLYLMTMQTVFLAQVLGGALASAIGAPHTVVLTSSVAFVLNLSMLVVTPIIRRLD